MTLNPAARAAEGPSRAAPAASEASPSVDASGAAAASDTAGSSAAAAALGSAQQAWAASGHFAETLPNAQEWLAQHGEVRRPHLALHHMHCQAHACGDHGPMCPAYAPESFAHPLIGYKVIFPFLVA